jgi:uncharacterized protein DUF1837
MSTHDALFTPWCDCTESQCGVHGLTTVAEMVSGRPGIMKLLGGVVRWHYDDPQNIADALSELGYEKTAELIKLDLPETKRARSGDIGEILASEYVDRRTDYRVPVRKLRFKDQREMSLRGDDVIAVREAGGQLHFLKGEVKSRKVMGQGTINAVVCPLRSGPP